MILLTGKSGLLGQHLDFGDWEIDSPTHKELDITKPIKPKDYDMIIHSAAYTDVVGAETHRQDCYETNVVGTFNLLKAYPDIPFIYISTEYAKHPVNTYAKSKTMAEFLVQELAFNYLIIRTLFKPNPFPYAKAFKDQWTQGDYVDKIAPLIVKEIKRWQGFSKTVYVGTGRKTIYDLAKKTRPDVKSCSIRDVVVDLPKDYL